MKYGFHSIKPLIEFADFLKLPVQYLREYPENVVKSFLTVQDKRVLSFFDTLDRGLGGRRTQAAVIYGDVLMMHNKGYSLVLTSNLSKR